MSYVRKHFERYLTPQEEKQLFDYVDQFKYFLARRDRAWLGLLRQTGIRINVMAQLTVDDAKEALISNYLHVRPEINKRKQGYSVRVNKEACRCLKVLLSVRREMGYTDKDALPLVMGRNHSGLSVRSYQERLKHWRVGSGITVSVSPHWLRHTLAKRIISTSISRNPMAIVQSALGHSNIISTGVYTMPDKEEIAASMEAAS